MAKLLYFISEDWFFCSHFLDRAIAAQRAGHEVLVLTRVAAHGERLRQLGFRLLPLRMERSGTHPLRELGVLRQVWRAYRAERPELLHHVALKPILYGSLVARCLGLRAVVNAPVGMGYVFTAGGARGRALRALVRLALRALLDPPGSKVVFENEEDLAASVRDGSVRADDAVLIRGAGVDMAVFAPAEPPAGTPVVVLGARMLRDKGVQEFVAAARLLRARQVDVRCVLVGAPDPANPSSLTREQLERWQAEGAVEWWGHRDDMAAVLRQCHIACLPSYREGLPKFLLEAMACGLAVVSTDATGCRQAVEHGVTGLLVPPRDAGALARALERLLRDGQERAAMGRAGRERVQRLFDDRIVVRDTVALYRQLMAESVTVGGAWR
ncbi:glycosyltransferase family 4 protein [Pseudorhodoferax sp.]|uniref:glycosyltransferase family 4 protein n=1 Tax=Pseudorhodoferax sp. TaxID=1993553 RepID=UPI0039E36752